MGTDPHREGAGSRYVRADLEAYFRIPAAQREPASYLLDRGTSGLPKFTAAQIETLNHAAIESGDIEAYLAREKQ